MKKLKIYLDTSIINFAIADDINEEDRRATQELCEAINTGEYEGFISEVVLREIAETPSEERHSELRNYLGRLEIEEPFKLNEEIVTLAEKYISEGVIPTSHRDDALHVAIATVNNLDILATWNFKHLVKYTTRIKVSALNTFMGYKTIDICTPREVISDV